MLIPTDYKLSSILSIGLLYCLSIPVQSTNSNSKLGSYLAGLIEGDGSIIVPSSLRDKKGKKQFPHIEIEFAIEDFLLAKKLQEVLNGGYISNRPSGQSCRLVVKDNATLLKVVNLINGCMRTPKIEALHRLIEWLNTNKELSDPLLPLGLDISPLSSNNWLSGIMDADGHFYFNWKLDKKGLPTSLEYYMRISQKRTYSRESSMNKDFLSIMESIAEYFDTKVTLIDRTKNTYRELAYLVRVNKINSKTILLDYLEEHPLFSYKHFAVMNFK